ncbi:MAG: ATP-binding cassette domain-containing protein [Deltaproteobacteria bacterium]|nr:ATP-binding cassette domain-containing protein [Deltaproteobacteria bacterium]
MAATNLGFGFGRRALFSRLALSIAPGEIVGLIGPPEAGKSVLLKLLSGLLDPSAGEVTLDGQSFAGKSEAERYPLRRHIGMLFQNTALFDSLTIYDNVAFPLRALVRMGDAIDEGAIDRRVKEALASVGLIDSAHQFPHELSGGMKKRAGLARATVTKPRYCFYDEPTAGLDPVTSAKIYALIRAHIERDGAGALIISNELDTLLPACHRVLMLYDGALVFSGTPAELERASHPAVRQFATGANEGPL